MLKLLGRLYKFVPDSSVMNDIFISYSSKDRAWVEGLARLLTAQGYRVWWDSSLLAGHHFHRTIAEKLEAAHCVIVVWTEHAVESDWVLAEADRARARRVIVPIQLRDAPLPLPFNRVHTENFQSWQGGVDEQPFQRLLRAIEQHVAAKNAAVKPKPRLVQGRPAKFLPRVRRNGWAALSAVLLFGVVYAVNGFYGIRGDAAQGRAVDKTPLITASTQPAPAGAVIALDHGLRLVNIPRGRFQMGSQQGRANAKPVHTVTIGADFWMSQTEVSFAQYAAYAKATGQAQPDDYGWGRGSRPVINVSWHDTQGFVQWLSANNKQGLSCRLPSEAEWEYAARAGTTTAYSWGDQIAVNQANCNGCGSQWDNIKTAPVARFAPNAFGLYDMHGNVREWVQDKFYLNYQNAPTDGTAWESGGSNNRVIRGGSWDFSPPQLAVALRGYDLPRHKHASLGFRIVCSRS